MLTRMGLGLGLGMGGGVGEQLGPNLLTNGDFGTGDLTSWTDDNAHYSVISGAANHPSSSVFNTLRQSYTVTTGVTLRVKFTLTGVSGTVRCQMRTAANGVPADGGVVGTANADGSYSFDIVKDADYDGIAFARDSGTAAFSVDDVSLQEIL